VIDIAFHGSASRLTLAHVMRDRLYGHARRVGLDAAGRDCASALLTRVGTLLGPGGAAGLYLDERGDVVARDDFAADGADGSLPVPGAAEGSLLEVSGPVPAEALLAHAATAVYTIADMDTASPLGAALAAGAVFQASPAACGLRSSVCFLLVNEHGAFLIAAEPVRFDFVEHDTPPPADDDPDESDDLGFDEVGGAR